MDNKTLVKHLHSLAQLDVDAFHAYGQAIEKVDYEPVRDQLSVYREEHRNHYDELSRVIRHKGGEPPKFTKDFKGYMIEGMTSLRSITGIKGALEAMETNEKLTNKHYERAASNKEMPPEVGDMLSTFHQDEQRHLSFVQETLRDKPWEKHS